MCYQKGWPDAFIHRKSTKGINKIYGGICITIRPPRKHICKYASAPQDDTHYPCAPTLNSEPLVFEKSNYYREGGLVELTFYQILVYFVCPTHYRMPCPSNRTTSSY